MRTQQSPERKQLGTEIIGEISDCAEWLATMPSGTHEADFYDIVMDEYTALLNGLDIHGQPVEQVRFEFDRVKRTATEVKINDLYEAYIDVHRGLTGSQALLSGTAL